MDDFAFKVFPFRESNRIWAIRLFQGYLLIIVIGIVIAGLINFNEGDKWQHSTDLAKGQKVKVTGKTAFDEILWFVFTNIHGIDFGEFQPKSSSGDIFIAIVVAISYWGSIFMMAVVMMSQLPGIKPPTLWSMLISMGKVAWPSYAIFCAIAVCIGYIVGPYMADGISSDVTCAGACERHFNLLGIQWLWHVMHRAPEPDIWPDTPFGRTVTVPTAALGYLYPPYVLALIAIRRPTPTEHAQLLAHMNAYPEAAMGPGYIVPPSGPREIQFTSIQSKDGE